MRFSQERIQEIKTIMKERFDKDVTDDEAQLIGMATLNFVLAKAKSELIILNITEEEING